MGDSNTRLFWLFGALFLFDVVVSRGVILDSGLSWSQKSLQLAVIWLIPVIGGAVVLAMQGQNHTVKEMRSLYPFPFYFAGYKPPYKDPGPKFGDG
jgi:hypothetical protein